MIYSIVYHFDSKLMVGLFILRGAYMRAHILLFFFHGHVVAIEPWGLKLVVKM